jgi:hypothetical protein
MTLLVSFVQHVAAGTLVLAATCCKCTRSCTDENAKKTDKNNFHHNTAVLRAAKFCACLYTPPSLLKELPQPNAQNLAACSITSLHVVLLYGRFHAAQLL